MDGSAKQFLNIFNNINIKTLNAKKNYLKVVDKIELLDGERKISIEPNDETLEIEFQLNYNNKIIGNQKNSINFYKDNLNDVSKSRTFCLYQDIEKIKKVGLAKGGSLDNAVIVDDDKIINKDGLRNEKEFVNHKILDLLGDIFLSGYRILGKINCHQGGHQLTNMFLRKIFKNKSAFKIFEYKNDFVNKNSKSYQGLKVAVGT